MMETAFVLINCDLGCETEIIDELKHLDNVKETQEFLVHMIFL